MSKTISEVKWHSIGQVSKHFDISVSRLRGWCDSELVENVKDNRGRKIPQTEFEKIEKIIEIFDQRGGTTTLDEVKDELRKNDLLRFEVAEQQQDERVNDILQAFGQTGLADLLQQLQQQLNQVQQGVLSLPSEPQVSLTEAELKRVSDEQFTKIKGLFEKEIGVLKEELQRERDLRQKSDEQVSEIHQQLEDERELRKKAEEKLDVERESIMDLTRKLQAATSRLEQAEETNEKLMGKFDNLTVWSLFKKK
ncbi:MAG: hypothetical protein WBV93_08765 [Anaerobacillus sp.]